MKFKSLILLLCLLLFQQITLAQLTYPYFQNFESRTFINSSNINLDVNGPEPLPRDETNVSYGYGYSWEIGRSPKKDDYSLKLTVHKNDHNKNANSPRSRSEVAFLVDNQEAIYISYQIFIPDDGSFTESFEKDTYHILQQFQATLWDKNRQRFYNVSTIDKNGKVVSVSDLLGVLILFYSDKNVKNNYRDLEFWTNDPKNIELYALGEIDEKEYTKRRMRLKIINGIEKGKWNEIITKILFSEKSSEGSYQFWINRNPVVLDSLGDKKYNEYYTSPKNVNKESFALKTGNVLQTYDLFRQRIPSLIKLGHYRQNLNHTQSLYIDNFRVWERFPVPFTEVKGKTRLLDEQCNNKVGRDNLILYSYDDPEAIQYTFRYRNIKNGKIKLFFSDGPAIDMRYNRTLKGKKTYEVDVRTTGEFGEKCIIRSLKSN